MASAAAKKIIEQAKRHFKACVDAEHESRAKALDDLRFLAGEQWTPRALAQRARDERPALVVNRLDQFVQQITNTQRQNRVSARVFPVDDKGDVDTAEVIQGLVRQIENESKATMAYGTAGFYAVAMGWGYWRLTTDYCDPMSFDLDIKIERIPNPFQVYLGPHSMPDGSDAPYAFFFTDMARDEFESEYPKAEAAGMKDWASIGDQEEWLSEDKIRVVEYYCMKYDDDTLVRMADGTAKLKSQLGDGDQPAMNEAGELIERETRIPTVLWYKLNGVEILDQTEWAIPKIPIVKVTGHELTVDGKLELKGIVRNLKDAQRQYNYMLSAQTEAIDSSKGPVMLAEGQEEGHEDDFRNLNRQSSIRYKPTSHEGHIVPAPTRLPPNMSIQQMNEARMMAAEDLKALTGIYDAALGNRSNETSGKGILARQQQSDTANFHFEDNLTMSVSHSCRMTVDLIGKIYDTARTVRIVGEDDSQKVVKVNQQYIKENGEPKLYDLRAARYDVVCTAGPSFQTKRQEGAQLFTQLASAAPILMNAAPDLIVKTYDVPYAQEIAERLARTLPPGLLEQEGQEKIPPAAAQQLQEMGQMIELLTKELNATKQIIQTKQPELESRERIEMAKLKAQVAMNESKSDSAEAIAVLKAEVEAIKAQIAMNTQAMAANAKAAAQTM
jgi:hypothetical protein